MAFAFSGDLKIVKNTQTTTRPWYTVVTTTFVSEERNPRCPLFKYKTNAFERPEQSRACRVRRSTFDGVGFKKKKLRRKNVDKNKAVRTETCTANVFEQLNSFFFFVNYLINIGFQHEFSQRNPLNIFFGNITLFVLFIIKSN